MELKEAKIANYYELTFGTEQGADKALVRIPHYQRPYRWPTEYINTLINDWKNENSGKYFTGSIVTVKSDSGIEHQLIDGQQRFTTIFLINFVCFLIVRVAVREAILYKRARVSGLLDSLLKSATYLYGNYDLKKFEVLKEATLEKIDNLENVDLDQENEIQTVLLNDFLSSVYLPAVNEGKEEYKAKHRSLLEHSFIDNGLKLSYDRSSFNLQLRVALVNSLVKLDSQNEISLEFFDVDDNPVVTQYRNSIETIFEHFSSFNKCSTDEPLVKAIKTIKVIEKFLTEVNFCVIQTGSVNDAYTLFEVLNDRALSLDDLDLIKNQFYKKFCLSNINSGDFLIDTIIEQREAQWGESIFPDGLKIAHKPLVTYMFSSFYSGETDYLIQSSEKNRVKITNYLNSLSSYGKADFCKDFNALEACTKFVNSFDIWHKNKNKKALKAEYSVDSSSTYKLVHLLSALGQFGVLVGLTNVIFKYIEKNISESFEPKAVQRFFEDLAKKPFLHSDINDLSSRIWQLVMQAPSAEKPREYAVRLIKNNNIRTREVDYADTDFLTKSLRNDLELWLDNWRYNKSDIKVCLLFARIIKSSTKELSKRDFQTTLSEGDVEKLHLDHMEPSSVPQAHKSSYFESEDRQVIVNGLGNMFPLPGSLNMGKSNQPFVDAFRYIEESGLGEHWLVAETKTLFDLYNEEGIPTQEFFQKRKAALKELFYKAIECG